MVKTPSYDQNGMKKGAWSEDEDNRLKAYIQRYGHWNWKELPKFAGLKRCGKSCRLRWLNYLKPDLKHGNYTKEEEELIVKLHEKLGSRWSLIAARLPGRTDNEIKNYWHTHLKKRSPRCRKCEMEATNLKTESSDVSECITNDKSESMEPIDVHSDAYHPAPQEFTEPSSMASSSSTTLVAEQCGLDFWTQPFLEDKFYAEKFESPVADHERESSSLEESIYTYYMDAFDDFSEWMHP